MKQRKFGKKVQNWHRPLGPNDLPTRYVRNRTLCQTENDAYWDLYDPVYYQHWEWDWGDGGTAEDLARVEFDEAFSRLLKPRNPLINPSLMRTTDCNEPTETVLLEQDDRIANESWSLIERFAGLSRGFQSISESQIETNRILEVLNRPMTAEAVARIHATLPNSMFVKSLCWFAPFWIRHPAQWEYGDEKSLIDHLLVRHEVPSCLYNEWRHEQPRFKWLSWFILLAQGADLKGAAEEMGWRVHRKLTRFLFDVPASFSPIEATLFAEVRRLGGTDLDAQRVLSNPAFVIDPTEKSSNERHFDFWHETVRWLIKNSDQLSDDNCSQIMSWAMHEFTEATRVHLRFSMKRRTIAPTLIRSHTYHELVSSPWAEFRWEAHEWNWSVLDSASTSWSFVELTSGEELFVEGQALHHCVASYAARCATGYSAIVSVRKNGVPCVTVEINPRSKQMVQARGLYNRSPFHDEESIIRDWLRTIVRKQR